ncbi:MAG TPA: GH3 auxin-responsive promoter family protein, partial [Chloroflexota bacterium]
MTGDRVDISRVAAQCAWLLLSLPDALAYRRALRAEVAETQATILRGILRRNAETEFGRQHRFEKVRSIRDFQTSVPLTTYADYTEAIERIGCGQAGVLSSAPVTVLEPTSGSTSATKYVPYTRRLERQFQQALAPWIVELYSRHPHLVDGQAYWSISPVGGEHQRTSAGIPIGFADDSAYLGGARGALVRSMLAVPPAIRLIPDVAAFRYATLLFLLRSRRLALVSVWSPSFLQLLCRPLPDWWPRLADDIQDGRLTPPVPIPPAVLRQLSAWLTPDPARAAEIRAIFARHADQPAAYHRALWPKLRLISCWADGSAAEHARDLARLFPGAHLQPKGLVATE